MNKADRTPFFGALNALLKSRRAVFSVVMFVISVLLLQVPDLAAFRQEIVFLAGAVIGVVVLGLSWEDAAAAASALAKEPPKTPADYFRDTVNHAVDDRAKVIASPPELATLSPEAIDALRRAAQHRPPK